MLPTLQAVVEMYKEGLFTELGVSNFTAWQVMQIRDVMRKAERAAQKYLDTLQPPKKNAGASR